MHERCDQKIDVYSRVCGYFRPVAAWNDGKQEEFKNRKYYSVSIEQNNIAASQENDYSDWRSL